MKILHIRGKNLASLPEFHLNLERGLLAEAGIFAITGPTGSGKSTLLDTLCLALFDRAPRFESRSRSAAREGLADSDPRNCLRRGTAQGFAQVVFRGREGHTFQATWSVKRAYLKPDGRLGPSTLAFENLTTGANLTGAGKKETLDAIERALGLGYDQFCRSVLLAQGEFAQFLRSPPNEKAQLLESLTGTALFGEISKTAFRLARSHAADVKTLDQEANALEASFGEESVHDSLQAVEGHLIQREAQLSALDASRIQHENALADLDTKLSLIARMQDLQRELTALGVRRTAAQQALRAAGASYELKKSVLETKEREHEALRALYEDAKALDMELVSLESAHRKLLLEATRCVEDATKAQNEETVLTSLVNVLTSFSVVSRNTTSLPVQPFEQPVGATLPPHPLLVPLREALQKRERQALLVAQAEEKGRSLREACEKAGADPSSLSKPGQAAASLSQERTSLTAWLGRLNDAHEALLKAHTAGHACLTASRDCAQQERVALETQQALQEARRSWEQADADWSVALQHDDLRARRGLLKKNTPCPLCGSREHPATEHPATEHLATESATHDGAAAPRASAFSLTRQLEHERTQAAQRVEELSQGVAAARTKLALLKKEHSLQAEKQAAARSELKRLCDVEGPFEHAARSLHDTCESLLRRDMSAFPLPHEPSLESPFDEAQNPQARPAVRNRLAQIETLLPLLSDLHAFRATYQERKAALREDELQVERAAHHARTQGVRCLEEAKQAASLALAAQRRCEDEASSLLAQITGVRDARAKLPPQIAEVFQVSLSEVNAARRALECAQREHLEASNTAASLEGMGEEKERALQRLADTLSHSVSEPLSAELLQTLQHTADALRQQLHSTQDEARAVSVECGRLAAKRDALQVGMGRLVTLREKLEQARKRASHWEALSSLIGSADGALFRRKAQSITLGFLVESTNDTLERLCPRYRLLRAEGGDLDLLVSDTWMDDTPRNVSTLSGGETFLLSLALALGLSQLSSRHVFLGTLFVDEGFGTLDPVTLETTLAMFDALQSDGRQVGLISHVPGLAERLGARVVITPQGQGASQLTVED